MKQPKLTRDERTWLREYCKALGEQYPGAVLRLLIYGSNARGDAGPESDLDVLLIVNDKAASQKRKLRRVGYMLAAASSAVPSILAYTEDEWASRARSGSPFLRAVEHDAVRVL
ncbi:MAG: nucleotidyltransferase domain-containing protein [Betaproteobacteria bacterium]|nr:nucleotidyltransferase domain-containing protein [Betaproteobacteria bacterium]